MAGALVKKNALLDSMTHTTVIDVDRELASRNTNYHAPELDLEIRSAVVIVHGTVVHTRRHLSDLFVAHHCNFMGGYLCQSLHSSLKNDCRVDVRQECVSPPHSSFVRREPPCQLRLPASAHHRHSHLIV